MAQPSRCTGAPSTSPSRRWVPSTATSGTALNNLVRLYEIQGRYAGAEPLHKRSLALREQMLGPEHPDVGMALNNLGSHSSAGLPLAHPRGFPMYLLRVMRGAGPAISP
jgi:hypothetical protein